MKCRKIVLDKRDYVAYNSDIETRKKVSSVHAIISAFFSGLAIGIVITNIAYRAVFYAKSVKKGKYSEDGTDDGSNGYARIMV